MSVGSIKSNPNPAKSKLFAARGREAAGADRADGPGELPDQPDRGRRRLSWAYRTRACGHAATDTGRTMEDERPSSFVFQEPLDLPPINAILTNTVRNSSQLLYSLEGEK